MWNPRLLEGKHCLWDALQLDGGCTPSTIRWALSRPASAKYINTLDEHGVLMLERSAFHYRLDLVKILLDAKTDASLPIATLNGFAILPLHIVCLVSEVLQKELRGHNPRIHRIREEEVAESDEDVRKRLVWNVLDVSYGVYRLGCYDKYYAFQRRH